MKSKQRHAAFSCAAVLAVMTTTADQSVVATSSGAILLEGTVVTMNAAREVIPNGRVLVRDGRIVAVWRGSAPPQGVDVADAVRAPLGEHAYIYPGLINLHDHPFFGVLPLWQPPRSHVQPAMGRPLGTEPYGNRYQWNQVALTQPEEAARLVSNPSTMLTDGAALASLVDVIKFAKARMILGGTTTTQGAGSNAAYDSLLARTVESANFGRRRIFSRVGSIGSLSSSDQALLQGGMAAGLVDAWLIHLAEGVRDADRRAGDVTSSRAEFTELKARQLLSDATVVLHGVGLEPQDFVEMAHARPARADGAGDGRGAKLVWSPLSNLLLYGTTTAIYDALAAGVLVSLGTDWAPSGSANLLTELKVADRTLRDVLLLGGRRDIVPWLAVSGAKDAGAKERALDQLLVEMVTINPALAVRWDDQVGSIEAGKVADILVIDTKPLPEIPRGIPASPYRRLIDATERNVSLVMVGGAAQAGDVAVMSALKPGDFDVVAGGAGCFEKAIDVTAPALPGGSDSFDQVVAGITEALRALGGDHPPAGGGPSSPFANTWSYLKARIPGASDLPDLTFNLGLAFYFGSTADGRVNLEAIRPPALFTVDDHWWFATLASVRDSVSDLTADTDPPYALYLSNSNQETAFGSPFAADLLHNRWYEVPCGVH
ncbi:S-triazine hydrolase [Luteitalea pratensis]|uniref:S-triazine hydrolase n=2 Tax=Luteitalea pratensis TaxID=1855912 RepID=A0A143PN61_LUTPR|nr:S-triazine hydrolase [Luteitalea pratensis]